MIDILKVLDYYDIHYTHSGFKRFKAICPFHDDTNPSLVIYTDNEERHSYACFSCNNFGGADWFIKEMGDNVNEVLEEMGLDKVKPFVKRQELTLQEVDAVLSPMYRELLKGKPELEEWVTTQWRELDDIFQLWHEEEEEAKRNGVKPSLTKFNIEQILEQHIKEIRNVK